MRADTSRCISLSQGNSLTSITTSAFKANATVNEPTNGIPRIELDTQFVGSVSSLTSSQTNMATAATTPGILGLSSAFVVSSDFRKQVALLNRPRAVPSVTTSDVSKRPPPYNPDYLTISQPSWSLSSSKDGQPSSIDSQSSSQRCEASLSFASSAEKK